MAIKSIVVHPKGATHIQKLFGFSYFLKQNEDGDWFFFGPNCKVWLFDENTTNGMNSARTCPLR